MFTAEELENFDIFPKKYTIVGVIRGVFYSFVSLIALILMYSFYSGRDFISIISLESLSFADSNYLAQRLAALEPDNIFSTTSKYYLNFTDNVLDVLIKKYVMDNFPVLMKGSVSGLNITQINDEIVNYLKQNSSQLLYIEKRSDPYIEFYKKGFEYKMLNYDEFLEVTEKDKTNIYLINENDIGMYKKTKEMALDKHLEKISTYYSKGRNMTIIGGHSENTENIVCLTEGEIDLMLIPSFERGYITNYKSEYGPPNYSPIQFFRGDFSSYPLFKKANRIQVSVSKGDCLYIPSFWFRSVRTSKKAFEFISFKYKPVSRYLDNIFKGIEVGEL